jgi:hypothetical protein
MMRFLGKLFASGSDAERSGKTKAPAAKIEAGTKTQGRTPPRKGPTAAPRAKPAPAADLDDDEHFDPYNTGVFDRSAPWDRVRKRK